MSYISCFIDNCYLIRNKLIYQCEMIISCNDKISNKKKNNNVNSMKDENIPLIIDEITKSIVS